MHVPNEAIEKKTYQIKNIELLGVVRQLKREFT